jgi:Cd2+/Zn2+-exporting ATPase
MTDKVYHHKNLEVVGMDCADCALHVEKAVNQVPGIKLAQVNFISGNLKIEYDEQLSNLEEVEKAVKSAGYSLKKPTRSFWQKNKPTILTSLSGIFAAAGSIVHFSHLSDYIAIPLFAIAIVTGGFPIAIKGFKEARHLTLGMDFLMSIAVIGAMIIGEWTEAAYVIFLFSLAELIESYSVKHARRSIESLMELAPDVAHVKTDSGNVEKPVESIAVSNVIIIRPGDRVPLDGEVIAGSSTVNQAPITGESIPVDKSPGEEVFAGTINLQGILEVKVSKRMQDSMLARIIRLVEEAQARKAPTQQFVEKFSRYYTPAMVSFAILVAVIPPLLFGGIFTEWFYRALVLLVISCPCALVISTPVTIVSGLTNAARNGILIKGGSYLENFNKIRVLAFDKTGTLTTGKPAVQSIQALNHHSPETLLQVAASLEANSEHPLAKAITDYAAKQGITPLPVDQFMAIPGKGARGVISGELYYIGNHRLFEEEKICREAVHTELEKLENRSHTAILVGNPKNLLGLIAIADEVRDRASPALQKLKQLGIRETVMLTGDNTVTARAIAGQIGIDKYEAELLPDNKVEVIQQLMKNRDLVAMVGDGINDAPALASATMGIAMGVSGSDTAIETSDIALMEDDLSRLPYLKRLSRRTVRIIKQNIFIALFLKGIFFALAIPGLATLWMAVFADMGASLMVIFNGLRVLKSNPS